MTGAGPGGIMGPGSQAPAGRVFGDGRRRERQGLPRSRAFTMVRRRVNKGG
ncbi:MAG: hypothetical protein M0Z41_15825 [Peptococcaceae bacterium]|nr:hypothetical protein [Peptococcaceae bacterium]